MNLAERCATYLVHGVKFLPHCYQFDDFLIFEFMDFAKSVLRTAVERKACDSIHGSLSENMYHSATARNKDMEEARYFYH